MSLPFAIQSVPSRGADAEALAEQLPGARTFEDATGDYMKAYLGMLREYAGTPFVRLEDDVTLCQNFLRRITAAVGLHRQTPINFFFLGNKNRSRHPERHGGALRVRLPQHRQRFRPAYHQRLLLQFLRQFASLSLRARVPGHQQWSTC